MSLGLNLDEVAKIAADWRLAAPPIRPGRAALDAYARNFPAAPGFHALVQGATPELLDLCVRRGVTRIVSLELHPESMAAMQRLACEDVGRVEFTIGNWCEPPSPLHGAFDLVLCDGGPLFLPFPDGWRQLFGSSFRCLKPGGAAVFRTFTEPDTPPDAWAFILERLARYERESASLDEPRRVRGLIEALSEAKTAAYYGCVDRGRVVIERLDPVIARLAAESRRRYTAPCLAPVLDGMFGKVNQVGGGARLVAMPRYEEFRPVLEGIGFRTERFVVPDPPDPGLNVVVVARKPTPAK